MIKLGKKIDEHAIYINGVVVEHFIDGTFNIFESEHDYKCYTYDEYERLNELYKKKVKIIYELIDLLEFLDNLKTS